MGIENTVVIGCPSNFINPSPTLGEVIEEKLLNTAPQNLIITAGSPYKSRLKLVEWKLLSWLRKYKGAYVCQAPQEQVSLALNRENEIAREILNKYRRLIQPNILTYFQPYSNFITFVKQYFRVFFDVSAWLEFLSGFDFSIGTRMHGNLLATQASTPGICIYHDSRTQELCKITSIPHVSINKFLTARNIQHVVELASFDGRVFDKKRAKYASEYRNLLLKSGISISTDLETLVKAG